MDEHLDSSQGSKKRTRGPTTCKKAKSAHKSVEKTIEFDEHGTPIGRWKYEFASYIGAVARRKADINIDSWKAVDETLKEIMWDDIKQQWNIKDDERKKQTMLSMGKAWRDFKTRLVSRYVRVDKDARDKYDWLTIEQWEQFKATHETEEFQIISNKAKESQQKNIHPHYLGKAGYAGKRVDWIAADPIASLTSTTTESDNPSLLSDDRSGRGWDWIRARSKEKAGGGYYIPADQTMEVYRKMEEWQGKASEGSWTPHGHDDILSRALGKKEHGGRVRGVGGKIRIGDVFVPEKSTQSSGVIGGVIAKDELVKITKQIREECKEEFKEEINGMQETLRGILDHIKQMGLPIPAGNFGFEISKNLPNNEARSSCHSVEPADPFLHIQKFEPCRLYVVNPDSSKLVIVARGIVVPPSFEGANVVHGQQVALDNVKVSVDDACPEFQSTYLPVPTNELKRVGDSVGSFVQWPKNLVRLGKDPSSVEQKKIHVNDKHVLSKGSTTPIQKKEGLLGGDLKVQTLSENITYLHDLIIENWPPAIDHITVDKDRELFKHNVNKDAPIFVMREDIKDLLTMSCLDVSILQIHIMYIYKVSKELNESFGFMCPSELALARERANQTSNYITNVMCDSQSKPFILAPYFQDAHWMLLLICCRENIVYMFDSLKRKRSIHVKDVLGIAFRAYVFQGGKKGATSRLDWSYVQCPQQEGGTECGYFVMRFMYDIVTLYHKNPEIKWKEAFSRKKYTQHHIDQIREAWAKFFRLECV